MKQYTYYIYIVLLILLPFVGRSVTSCSETNNSQPVPVKRLDLALRDGTIPKDTAMRNAAEILFALSAYGELNDSSLQRYASNPSIRFHQQAVDSVWNNLSDHENSLGRMNFNFQHLFPDGTFPTIYSIISPFNQSVLTTDTILFVGLNHYLGSSYPAYEYFPEYIRARKTPARLLPDIAEAVIRRDYPFTPQEDYPTVLSRILYEGAVVEAVMQLTGISEQNVLGYNDTQMKWIEENEKNVWSKLVGGKMLFSTDTQLAASLVNPAPFTSTITPDSPGMAGRFVGHRIVSSYLDRHAVPLSELLSNKFYEGRNTLSDSGYN